MPDDPRDEPLIARCLARDEEAWRLLVRRYTSYIYSIAMRGFGLGAEEARDVVQETFMKVVEALPGYRGDGPFRAWLRQIVRSSALLRLRRRRATEPLEPLEDALRDPAQEDTLEQIERGFVVAEALAQLEPACRDVLSMFFFQGRSYRDIAHALAIPEGTVASRLARCLDKLRPKVGGRF